MEVFEAIISNSAICPCPTTMSRVSPAPLELVIVRTHVPTWSAVNSSSVSLKFPSVTDHVRTPPSEFGIKFPYWSNNS